MRDAWADGEVVLVRGSAKDPYALKRVGDSFHCTCPSWRNQRENPEARTCKHLKAERGEDVENARISAWLLSYDPKAAAAVKESLAVAKRLAKAREQDWARVSRTGRGRR